MTSSIVKEGIHCQITIKLQLPMQTTMDSGKPRFCSSCQQHQHYMSNGSSCTNKDEAPNTTFTQEPACQQNIGAAASFLIVPVISAAVDSTTTVAPTSSVATLENQLKLWKDKNLKDSKSSSQSSSSSSHPVVVAYDCLLEKLSIVKCTSCDKSVALLICENYYGIYDFLRDESKPDGWLQVESTSDILALFILNQIIYREYEVPDEEKLQVEYAFPSESDLVKILWINGNAVGFMTLKPKGSMDLTSMDWYRMTVVDTLFIRNSERRKGYALSAIQDVLVEFPDQNVGFSVPISLPMMQVLKKHLMSHPADRMKLWEIEGCGVEGNCQILWFLLQRR